ncbi:antA/AntB antirepressor family protein [Levilactobacillus brevis]|uniref:antA/AntB antirepressor family protein n=1 Tax=Levilactobacillus brevis TaxID=1580 RepID=UPI002012B62C|nr:antA/AntB antirepressor family protein [Levilactobacillus brevis]
MTSLQDLITGTTNENVAVDARRLHDFLRIGKDFSTWFKDMIDYGFTEGQDFSPLSGKSRGGRPRIEYAMALDMAKEVSMIQQTELPLAGVAGD